MSEITLDDLIPPNFDDVFKDVLRHDHTHYVFKGGRGSCKSSVIGFLIVLLITDPANRDKHAIVFRKTASTLRDSVYSQIQFAISVLGMAEQFRCTSNPMQIIYRRTGQRILFRGVDDKLKLKSLKAPFGYFAFTWLEEADTFAGMEEIRNVLQSAMRGGRQYWVFMSFNPPISQTNFMNQEVLIPRNDRLVHSSDYRTVPIDWLGDQFIAEAEFLKETNPRAYEHEYLGVPTGTGGEVFENLEIREITDEEIDNFDYIYHGLDWGYFPDPAQWVKLCYRPANQTVYIFDELRVNRMSNRELWEELTEVKGLNSTDRITADSAEPKSIADFRSYGADCRGTIKGPDSVRYSMKWLQSLRNIVIDPTRCPNVAREFSQYEYQRSKNDEVLNAFPDANNHSIDAVRYALNPVWKRKGQ